VTRNESRQDQVFSARKPSFVVASDHRGVSLKGVVVGFLKSRGLRVKDLGTYSDRAVDYPDYAFKAARAVSQKKFDQGVVICHSGIGVSVTANKVKGVRAALCQTREQAELARKHTDANVLALPAGFVTPELAKEILSQWLTTDFEGGRHERRVRAIRSYETKKRRS